VNSLNSDRQSTRLTHFTPLRYPGGKARLAAFVKQLVQTNHLLDGDYVEPYAGGAAIGIELLLHEYVSRIHINDISRPIYAFWKCVLDDTDELCRLVQDTRLTMRVRDKQKSILTNQDEHGDLALGFAMFFLNRTNRSGILNAGVIGGRDQSGPWKMDARYNADELVRRIIAIARMRGRIRLTRFDALDFLRKGCKLWPEKTLIYCDPPYYVKGRDLYYDYYEPEDHERVARFITREVTRQKWIVSYDNVRQVRDLYARCARVKYHIGYSARTSRQGAEIMFFCESLDVPQLVGSIKAIRERGCPNNGGSYVGTTHARRSKAKR
jgi:DNA adenine methylase